MARPEPASLGIPVDSGGNVIMGEDISATNLLNLFDEMQELLTVAVEKQMILTEGSILGTSEDAKGAKTVMGAAPGDILDSGNDDDNEPTAKKPAARPAAGEKEDSPDE